VYEALTKGGRPVRRCGFDDQRNDRSLEVPAWMFDAAACDHLRVVDTPVVDSQVLIELKAVLQTASRADVLQAQHPCLTVPGGADAPVHDPRAALAAMDVPMNFDRATPPFQLIVMLVTCVACWPS
jgi:hypothetical protein